MGNRESDLVSATLVSEADSESAPCTRELSRTKKARATIAREINRTLSSVNRRWRRVHSTRLFDGDCLLCPEPRIGFQNRTNDGEWTERAVPRRKLPNKGQARTQRRCASPSPRRFSVECCGFVILRWATDSSVHSGPTIFVHRERVFPSGQEVCPHRCGGRRRVWLGKEESVPSWGIGSPCRAEHGL